MSNTPASHPPTVFGSTTGGMGNPDANTRYPTTNTASPVVGRLDSGRLDSAGGSTSWAASSRSNSRHNGAEGGGGSVAAAVTRTREEQSAGSGGSGGRHSPEQAAAATAAAVVASLCSSMSHVSSPTSVGGVFALSSGDSRPASRHTAKQKQQQRNIRQQQQQQMKRQQEQSSGAKGTATDGVEGDTSRREQGGRPPLAGRGTTTTTVNSLRKRRVSAGAAAAAAVRKRRIQQQRRRRRQQQTGRISNINNTHQDEDEHEEEDEEDEEEDAGKNHTMIYAPAAAAANAAAHYQSFHFTSDDEKLKKPAQDDKPTEEVSTEEEGIQPSSRDPPPTNPFPEVSSCSPLPMAHPMGAGVDSRAAQPHSSSSDGPASLLSPPGTAHPQHQRFRELGGSDDTAALWNDNSDDVPHSHYHHHHHHPHRLGPSSAFVNENISFFDKSSFTPPQSSSGAHLNPPTAGGFILPRGGGTSTSTTPPGSSRGRSPPQQAGRPTSLRLGQPSPHTTPFSSSPPPPSAPAPLLSSVANDHPGRPGTAGTISGDLTADHGCCYSGLWTQQRAATSGGAQQQRHPAHYPKPLAVMANNNGAGATTGSSGSFVFLSSPNGTGSASIHMESSGPDEPSVFTHSYRAIMHSLPSTTVGDEAGSQHLNSPHRRFSHEEMHKKGGTATSPAPPPGSTASKPHRPYIYRPNDKKRELDVYHYYQGQQELADLVVAQEEATNANAVPENIINNNNNNSSMMTNSESQLGGSQMQPQHHMRGNSSANSGTMMSGRRASTSPGTTAGSSQNPFRLGSTVRGSQIFSDVCSRSGSVFGFAPELGATAVLPIPHHLPQQQQQGGGGGGGLTSNHGASSTTMNQFSNNTLHQSGGDNLASDFYSDKALHGGNAYSAGVNSPFFSPSTHIVAPPGSGRQSSVDERAGSPPRPHTSPFTLFSVGPEGYAGPGHYSAETSAMGGGPLGEEGATAGGGSAMMLSGENSMSRHRMSSAGGSRRGRPWRAGPPGTVPVKTIAGSVTRMHPGQAGKAAMAAAAAANNNNSLPSPPTQQNFAGGGATTTTTSSNNNNNNNNNNTGEASAHTIPPASNTIPSDQQNDTTYSRASIVGSGGGTFLTHISGSGASPENRSPTLLNAGGGVGGSHRRVTLKDPEMRMSQDVTQRRLDRHRAFQLRHQIRSFERRYRRRRGILETKKVDELLRAVADEHFAKRERVYRERVGDPNLEASEAVSVPLQQGRHILNGALDVQRREMRAKKRHTAISTGAWRRYRQSDSSDDDDEFLHDDDDVDNQSWLWEEEEEEENMVREELNPFTKAAQRDREERRAGRGVAGITSAARSTSSHGTQCPRSTSSRGTPSSPAHIERPVSSGGSGVMESSTATLMMTASPTTRTITTSSPAGVAVLGVESEGEGEGISSCGSDEPETDFWGVIPGGRRRHHQPPFSTGDTAIHPAATMTPLPSQRRDTKPLASTSASTSATPSVASPLTVGTDANSMTRRGIIADRFGGADLSTEPSGATYATAAGAATTTAGGSAGRQGGGAIDFGLDNGGAGWGTEDDLAAATTPEALLQSELTKAVNKIQMAHFAMGKNKGETLHELQRRHSLASAVHRARIGSCSASAMPSKAGTWQSRSVTDMPELTEGKISLSGATRSTSFMHPHPHHQPQPQPQTAVDKTAAPNKRETSSRRRAARLSDESSKKTAGAGGMKKKKKSNSGTGTTEPSTASPQNTSTPKEDSSTGGGPKSPLVHVIPSLPPGGKEKLENVPGGKSGGCSSDTSSCSLSMEQLEVSTNSPTPAYRSTLVEPQFTATPTADPISPPGLILDGYASLRGVSAEAAATTGMAAAGVSQPSLSGQSKRKSPDPTVTAYNVPLPKRLGRCLMQHKPLHRCVRAASRLVSFVLMRSLPRALYEGNAEDFALLMREEEAMLMEAIQTELLESLAAARAASAATVSSSPAPGTTTVDHLARLQKTFADGSDDTRGRFEHLLGVLSHGPPASSVEEVNEAGRDRPEEAEPATPERRQEAPLPRGGGVTVLADDPTDDDDDDEESGRRRGRMRTYPPSRGESATPGSEQEETVAGGSPSGTRITAGQTTQVDAIRLDHLDFDGDGDEEEEELTTQGLGRGKPPSGPLHTSRPHGAAQPAGPGLISLYALPAPPPLPTSSAAPELGAGEDSRLDEESMRSVRQSHVLRVERSRDLDAPSITSRMSGAPAFSKDFMFQSHTSTVDGPEHGGGEVYVSYNSGSVLHQPTQGMLQVGESALSSNSAAVVGVSSSKSMLSGGGEVVISPNRPLQHMGFPASDAEKSPSYSGSYPTPSTQSGELVSLARSGQGREGDEMIRTAEDTAVANTRSTHGAGGEGAEDRRNKNEYTLEELASMLPPSTELRPPPHGEGVSQGHQRLSKGDKRFGVLRRNSGGGGSAGGSEDEDSRTALFSSPGTSPTQKDRASAAWGTVGAVRRPFSKSIPDRITPSPKKRQAVRLSTHPPLLLPVQPVHEKIGIYGGAGGAALAALLSRSTSTMCKIVVALYRSAVQEAVSLETSMMMRGGGSSGGGVGQRKLSNSCGSLRSPSSHLRRTSSSVMPMQQRLFPPFPPDLMSMLKQYARRTPRANEPEELLTDEDREKVRGYIAECLFGGVHGFSPMAAAAAGMAVAAAGGGSVGEAVPSLPPMLALLLGMIEQKDVVLMDGAERPLTISPLLVMSHGGYGLAPFSGEPYKFLMRYRDQVDKVSRMLQQATDGPSPTRKVAFRPLLIERLIKPGQNLLPLSALMMALRHCVRHNSALRYEEARCFVGSIELRLMIDLMESFAELSDSFSHRHESVLAERELKRQKDEVAAAVAVAVENVMGSTGGGAAEDGEAAHGGADSRGGKASKDHLGVFGAAATAAAVNSTGGEEFSDLFFEIYHETLLDWSCVVICEAAIGYAMDLGGPGLAHFKLASYESTAILSDDQVDEILSSDLLDSTLPNIPFSRHNPQVAYSVVEKNRSVVLEALVRLKGELYFLLTGLDHRQNLLETHHRLLQVVKAGSLRRQQNRTVQRKVLPVDGATTHRTLGEEFLSAAAGAHAHWNSNNNNAAAMADSQYHPGSGQPPAGFGPPPSGRHTATSSAAGTSEQANACLAAAGRVGGQCTVMENNNNNNNNNNNGINSNNNRVQLIDIPLSQNVGFAFSLTSPRPPGGHPPPTSAANPNTGKRAGTAPSGATAAVTTGGGAAGGGKLTSPVCQAPNGGGGGRCGAVWPTTGMGSASPMYSGAKNGAVSSAAPAPPFHSGYPESVRSVSRPGGGGGGGGGTHKANSVSHGSIYHMHTSKLGGNCTLGIHHTTIEAMETAIEEVTAGMQCTPLQLVLFSLPMRGNVCTKKNVAVSDSDEEGDEESESMGLGGVGGGSKGIASNNNNNDDGHNQTISDPSNNNHNNHHNNNNTTTTTMGGDSSPRRNPVSCTVAGEDGGIPVMPWSPIQGGRLGGGASNSSAAAAGVGGGTGSIGSPGLLTNMNGISGSSWTSAPIRLLVPEGSTQVLQFDDDGTPLPGTGFNVSFTTKPVVVTTPPPQSQSAHPPAQHQQQSRSSNNGSGRVSRMEGSVRQKTNSNSTSRAGETTVSGSTTMMNFNSQSQNNSQQNNNINNSTSHISQNNNNNNNNIHQSQTCGTSAAGTKKRALARSGSPTSSGFPHRIGGGGGAAGSSRGVSPGSPSLVAAVAASPPMGSARLGGTGNSVFSASRQGGGGGGGAGQVATPPFYFGNNFLHRHTQDHIMATLVRHLQAMEDNRAAQNRTNVLLTGEFYEEGCPWSATNEAVGRRAADEAAQTQAKLNQSLERMQQARHGAGREGHPYYGQHHASHSHPHNATAGGGAAGQPHHGSGGGGAGMNHHHRGGLGGASPSGASSVVGGGRSAGGAARSIAGSSVRELPLGSSGTSTVAAADVSLPASPPPVIQEYFASKPHLVMNSAGQPNATGQQLLKTSQEKQIGFKSFKEEVDNEDVWDFKRTVEMPLMDPPGTVTPAMQRRRAQLPEAGKLVPAELLDRLTVTAEDILMKDPHQSAADSSSRAGTRATGKKTAGQPHPYVPPKPDEASSVADGGGIFRSENEKRKRVQQRFQASLAAAEAAAAGQAPPPPPPAKHMGAAGGLAGGESVVGSRRGHHRRRDGDTNIGDDIFEVYIHGDLDLRSSPTERARQWMTTTGNTTGPAASSSSFMPGTPRSTRPSTSPTTKASRPQARQPHPPPPRKAGSAGGGSSSKAKQQPWYTHGDGSFNHQRLVSKLKRSRPKDHFDLNAVSPLIALKSCVETRDLDPLPLESDSGVAGGGASLTGGVSSEQTSPRHSCSIPLRGSRPDSRATSAGAAARSTSRVPSASSMRRVSFQESPSACPSGSFTAMPPSQALGGSTTRATSPGSTVAPPAVFDVELIKNTNPFIASSPMFQSEIRRSTEAMVKAQQAALDDDERPGGKRRKALVLPPTTRNVVTSANTKLSLRQRGLRFRKEMLPWSKGTQNQPLKGDMYHL